MFTLAASCFIFLAGWAAITYRACSSYFKATWATSQWSSITHSHSICFSDHFYQGHRLWFIIIILPIKKLKPTSHKWQNHTHYVKYRKSLPIHVKNHWSWTISVASKAILREGIYQINQWKNVKYASLVAIGHPGSSVTFLDSLDTVAVVLSLRATIVAGSIVRF